MRLDEFNKRFDTLKSQVTSMKNTQKNTKRAEPAVTPAPAKAETPKQELNWRTQKPTEWRYDDGSPLVSKRGLPVGWLDEQNKFVALTYNAWNMKELRQALMNNRYNTPLFK